MIELTDQERAHAEMLLADDLFQRIFREIEHNAIEQMVNADIQDDARRQYYAAWVRSIRDLRWQLEAMTQAKPRGEAPA
jgi:hypothetical protein